MIVGFTGTSSGMTPAQKQAVSDILLWLTPFGLGEKFDPGYEAHHGLCEGADDEFDAVAKDVGYTTHGHPGVNKRGEPWKRGHSKPDVIHPELPFLVRNCVIVDGAMTVIAAPRTVHEQRRGSGTWHAIRYARTRGVRLITVWPDGTHSVQGKGVRHANKKDS